jgi:hypothetical protein
VWTGTNLLDGAGKEFSASIEEDAGLTLNSLPRIDPAAHHCIGSAISSSAKNDEEISKDGTNET